MARTFMASIFAIMTVGFTALADDVNSGNTLHGPPWRVAPASSDSKFIGVSTRELLSSNLIGLGVYDKAQHSVGIIKDVMFDPEGVKAYIIGVGGFLGMGGYYVAVQPSVITLSYNASDSKWHAAMDVTPDQIKAAPKYKY